MNQCDLVIIQQFKIPFKTQCYIVYHTKTKKSKTVNISIGLPYGFYNVIQHYHQQLPKWLLFYSLKE